MLVPLARIAWFAACPIQGALAVRRFSPPSPLQTWARTVAEGWRHGIRPALLLAPDAAHELAAAATMAGLADNHWARLWHLLAAPEDWTLAGDKLRLADRLRALDVPVAVPLLEIPRGTIPDLDSWPWEGEGGLFVKPRHGARAVGAMSIRALPERRDFLVGRGNRETSGTLTRQQLEDLLARLLRRDSLLVQSFLEGVAELADLSPGAPVELRMTTGRFPGGAAVLLACLAKIQPPGLHGATTLDNALPVLVDHRTGVMAEGFLFREPGRRIDRVPWNGGILAGRPLPGFAEAAALATKAAEALPGLPVIGWDILLTPAGPVILEANTSLSWSFIHLWHAATGTPPLLPEMVSAWLDDWEKRPRA